MEKSITVDLVKLVFMINELLHLVGDESAAKNEYEVKIFQPQDNNKLKLSLRKKEQN